MSAAAFHTPDWSPELRCLVAALCLDPDGDVIAAAAKEVRDWDRVVDLAAAHGVHGLAWTRLRHVAQMAAPPDVVVRWKDLAMDRARIALGLVAELPVVSRALSERGIAHAFFKGPVLSQRAYGDPSRRSYGDLDVVVSPADRDAACDALLPAGYEPDEPLTRSQWHAALSACSETTLVCRERGTVVDLHWRLSVLDAAPGVSVDSIVRRCKCVAVAGFDVPTLSDTDHLLYLGAHALRHGWARLGSASDIAHLAAAGDRDFVAVLDCARECGLLRSTLAAFAITMVTVGARVPPDVTERAAGDQRVRAVVGTALAALAGGGGAEPHRREKMRLFLASHDRPVRALAAAAARLARPGPGEWNWVTLPDRLYPLYWAVRPVRLLATAAGLSRN